MTADVAELSGPRSAKGFDEALRGQRPGCCHVATKKLDYLERKKLAGLTGNKNPQRAGWRKKTPLRGNKKTRQQAGFR